MARRKNDPRLDAIISWYADLKKTSVPAFLPLLADTSRYLVLKGGGGSGKSIFAGRKILERATSEPGHRILVVRKVGKTLKQSCWKQLLGQLSQHYPDSGYKVNKTDLTISFPNGSEILFSGLDDVEKLKSIYNIDSIWAEEASELLEGDLNQLDIRMRGESRYYKQIILSFNPISMNHWLKKRFFDRDDPRATVHESTYKDNPFLPEEDRQTLEEFRDIDEYYYTVYALGMWGVTGRTVFDGKAVTQRLLDNVQPVHVGYFTFTDTGTALTDIRWTEDKKGFIRIYKEPAKGVPYVIGGDTAGDGSDSFVGQVLDNRTGEQVCTLRHTFDEDTYAKQMYCLGRHYNDALIGIETNFSTYPVMELERLRYPHQYVRESTDTYTHKTKKSYGFRTDSKTRPVAISLLIKAARDDIRTICDKSTLEEMLTFVRSESWKPEAEEGAHDDCVMALAIAHMIRPQQDYLGAEEEKPKRKWTKSMREDYRRASRKEREYLRQKWGDPE